MHINLYVNILSFEIESIARETLSFWRLNISVYFWIIKPSYFFQYMYMSWTYVTCNTQCHFRWHQIHSQQATHLNCLLFIALSWAISSHLLYFKLLLYKNIIPHKSKGSIILYTLSLCWIVQCNLWSQTSKFSCTCHLYFKNSSYA